MSRRIPVPLLALVVLVLGAFCVQYGRYAGYRIRGADHLARGRAAMAAAGFRIEDCGSVEAETHPSRAFLRRLENLEARMRRAELVREERFAGATADWTPAEWAALEPFRHEVLAAVEHTPEPAPLNAVSLAPSRPFWPARIARHLLVEGGRRDLERGDVTGALRSWGAALDLAAIEWAGSPCMITLAMAQRGEVSVLATIRDLLPRIEERSAIEALASGLAPRLRRPRWTEADLHRAIRGEGVWLCAHFEEHGTALDCGFDPRDLGFGAVEEAAKLERHLRAWCAVGIADPAAVVRDGADASINVTALRANLEEVRRTRALALAALLARVQKERRGRWPAFPEEIEGLDAETAGRLVFERRPEGLVLAARTEAMLVARRREATPWVLQPAPSPKGADSH